MINPYCFIKINNNFTDLIYIFFSNATNIYTSFNYNEFTTNGLYFLNGPEPYNCTNAPSELCTNCYVIVFGTIRRKHQIILSGNNEHAWYRCNITDTENWRDWKQIGN